MARSEASKKREHDDMLSVLEKKGKCVRPDEDIYGWGDYHAEKHIRDYVIDGNGKTVLVESCAWILDSNAEMEEATLSLFEDTFSENSTVYVINAYPASCACGKYTERTIRYEGDLSAFVAILLNGQ